MSRVTITIGRPDSPRPVMRRIGRTLLVLCVVGVLFQALFPFDFLSDPSSFSRQVSRRLVRSTTIEGNEADWWINVLFFLPLGFALASIFKRQPKRWIYQLGAAAIVGPVLSGVVELAQVFLPGREASLGDVAANSIGCLVGSAAYLGVGDMVLEPIARGLRRAEGMLTERNALLVSTIYAALIIAAPLLIPRPGDISNWNGGFRLYVGNDKPNRPWSGLVREVDFVDRATTPLEAEQLPSLDRRLKQVYGSSLIASYSLLGEGSFLDSIGHAPPLNWVGHGVVAGEISPALVGTEQFLQSAEPVGAVIGPLIRAGRFSVLVRASSSLPDQDGPCGIASIENQAWGETNVEIAQDRSNLVVRVRSKLTGQYATKPGKLICGG